MALVAAENREHVMSVRKRKWITRRGVEKEAWLVDYVDGRGVRRAKTFTKKKDADAYHATVNVEVRQGVHMPDSVSVTVAEAAERWISYIELEGRERGTVQQYRQHVDLHIKPRIGREKLSRLTTPRVQAFRDELLSDLSRPMAKKVLTSLKSLLKDAQRRGEVAQNVALGVSVQADRRAKRKLQVGVDIPSRAEIKAIVDHLQGRWRPFMLTAIFCGLRASELRGLRWSDVDLDSRMLHVRQRADKFNAIGRPKSAAGNRTVPMPPLVANALREWKLACPPGALDLVFPNGKGNVESLANIVQRGLDPLQVAAGVTVDGTAKYGMHAFRHFYASWCINPKPEGLGLPPKTVQDRLGHSTIAMTMDTYGHLFPRIDDGEEMAAASMSLLA